MLSHAQSTRILHQLRNVTKELRYPNHQIYKEDVRILRDLLITIMESDIEIAKIEKHTIGLLHINERRFFDVCYCYFAFSI